MDSLQALKNRKQGAVLAVALALLLIWRVLATIQVGISLVSWALVKSLTGSIRRETTIFRQQLISYDYRSKVW